MDNAIYASLTRQSGLMREMRAVANNIANLNTSGFRREGVVFSEYMVPLQSNGETLAMANVRGRMVDLSQGGMTLTNGAYDLAIDGDGFFMVQTPQGNRLTRAGAFQPNAEGELVNPDGYPLLDDGQAPVVIPPGTRSVGIGEVATVPTSPAIANAIHNATGVRLTEIPIRPDRLVAALKGRAAA